MILPVQAALERLPPSLLQASADLAHVHDKPFAMWCCRWQSRVLPLALSLPSHSHWAILSSRSWLVLQDILSAIWFIPSRGRLAINADGVAFTLVPIVLIALYLGVRETSGSVRCTLTRTVPQTGGLGWRGFGTLPHPDHRRYAFNTEDAAFSFPPQGLTLRWFSVVATA